MKSQEIIDIAFSELKHSKKPYIKIENFSFLKGLKWEDDEFQKFRFLLSNSEAFEKHSNHAIKFSISGNKAQLQFDSWSSYQKSLKPKIDLIQWTMVIIAAISLAWNIYQDRINNNLLIKNNQLEKSKIELQSEINKLNEKITK